GLLPAKSPPRHASPLGWRPYRPHCATAIGPPSPSARSLSCDLIRSLEERTAEQQARVSILMGIDEPFREAMARAEELAAMLRKQSDCVTARRPGRTGIRGDRDLPGPCGSGFPNRSIFPAPPIQNATGVPLWPRQHRRAVPFPGGF